MPTRRVVTLAAGCLLALTLGAAPSRAAPPQPFLVDGRHPAHITAIRPGAGTVTIDVVQVLRDRAAVRAAGRAGAAFPESYALWIENRSPRLRTLRVAPGLRIDGLTEFATCERAARRLGVRHKLSWLDAELRRHPAYARSPYVFWVTVRDGAIHRLHLEKLELTPAC